jgi:hypothetical protein
MHMDDERRKKATEYKNRFNAETYDRINLTVPKGQKDVIKAHADQYDGGSVNGFLNRAISETMQRDRLHREKED